MLAHARIKISPDLWRHGRLLWYILQLPRLVARGMSHAEFIRFSVVFGYDEEDGWAKCSVSVCAVQDAASSEVSVLRCD